MVKYVYRARVMHKKDSSPQKTFAVLALLGSLSLVLILGAKLTTVLYLTDSPHKRYRVEIVQRWLLAERAVYLDAYRDGRPTVRRKLLYTGDFLDDDFRGLYRDYSWIGESALRIGSEMTAGDAQSSRLNVTNESPSRLSYLLIEAGPNKIILFDVEPGAFVSLRFPISGGFTSQGEFSESKKRLGVGANIPRSEAGPFEINVRTDNIIIKDGQRLLENTGCCASDRPDFDHEF